MCLAGCDLTRSDSNHVLTAHDVCVNVLATIFDIVVVQGTTRGLATTLVNFDIDVTHGASCVVVVRCYPSFLAKEGVVQFVTPKHVPTKGFSARLRECASILYYIILI